MKREDLLSKGFSEEQVTQILNTYHAYDKDKDSQIKERDSQIQTLSSESAELRTKYDELQKQLDEFNKSKLSEQEKLELDKKETARKLAEADKIYNTAKAKEILAGLDVPDTLINRLVTSDEKETIANANAYRTQFEAYKEQIEKTTKAQIQNLDAKPKTTNITQGSDTMTLDSFKKMTLTEQVKWKRENPEEYNTLTGN